MHVLQLFPDHLLLHGQTGQVHIHRTLENALVIPQRATFVMYDKRYVYVVNKDNVVHQREIEVQIEKDEFFVISEGLIANDKIIVDGIRHVHDHEQVNCEFHKPEEFLPNVKKHAE